jgi:hypothetical protein
MIKSGKITGDGHLSTQPGLTVPLLERLGTVQQASIAVKTASACCLAAPSEQRTQAVCRVRAVNAT